MLMLILYPSYHSLRPTRFENRAVPTPTKDGHRQRRQERQASP